MPESQQVPGSGPQVQQNGANTSLQLSPGAQCMQSVNAAAEGVPPQAQQQPASPGSTQPACVTPLSPQAGQPCILVDHSANVGLGTPPQADGHAQTGQPQQPQAQQQLQASASPSQPMSSTVQTPQPYIMPTMQPCQPSQPPAAIAASTQCSPNTTTPVPNSQSPQQPMGMQASPANGMAQSTNQLMYQPQMLYQQAPSSPYQAQQYQQAVPMMYPNPNYYNNMGAYANPNSPCQPGSPMNMNNQMQYMPMQGPMMMNPMMQNPNPMMQAPAVVVIPNPNEQQVPIAQQPQHMTQYQQQTVALNSQVKLPCRLDPDGVMAPVCQGLKSIASFDISDKLSEFNVSPPDQSYSFFGSSFDDYANEIFLFAKEPICIGRRFDFWVVFVLEFLPEMASNIMMTISLDQRTETYLEWQTKESKRTGREEITTTTTTHVRQDHRDACIDRFTVHNSPLRPGVYSFPLNIFIPVDELIQPSLYVHTKAGLDVTRGYASVTHTLSITTNNQSLRKTVNLCRIPTLKAQPALKELKPLACFAISPDTAIRHLTAKISIYCLPGGVLMPGEELRVLMEVMTSNGAKDKDEDSVSYVSVQMREDRQIEAASAMKRKTTEVFSNDYRQFKLGPGQQGRWELCTTLPGPKAINPSIVTPIFNLIHKFKVIFHRPGMTVRKITYKCVLEQQGIRVGAPFIPTETAHVAKGENFMGYEADTYFETKSGQLRLFSPLNKTFCPMKGFPSGSGMLGTMTRREFAELCTELNTSKDKKQYSCGSECLLICCCWPFLCLGPILVCTRRSAVRKEVAKVLQGKQAMLASKGVCITAVGAHELAVTKD